MLSTLGPSLSGTWPRRKYIYFDSTIINIWQRGVQLENCEQCLTAHNVSRGQGQAALSENFSGCSKLTSFVWNFLFYRVATQLHKFSIISLTCSAGFPRQNRFWSVLNRRFWFPLLAASPNLHMKRPKSPLLVKIHSGGDILLLLSAGRCVVWFDLYRRGVEIWREASEREMTHAQSTHTHNKGGVSSLVLSQRSGHFYCKNFSRS